MPNNPQHTVPQSVANVARQALVTHKALPLDEQVGGVTVAKALVKSVVDTQLLEKMRRFFTAQTKPYAESLQQQHTSHTHALIRSWDMYGGDVGKAWVERELKGAVKDGYSIQDPITELLTLDPDEVYDSFSVGAWRWEFGLTPQTATTFCEEYQRATGNVLDLGKAFGASAATVGNLIHRKYNAPNSFEIAMKALKIDDSELQVSAKADLSDYKTLSTTGLSESLKSAIWKQSLQAQGKILWQVLIAHCILLVEAPHLMTDAAGFDSKTKPALPDEGIKNATRYSDAVNTYHNYFHPETKLFDDTILDDPLWLRLQSRLQTVLVWGWLGKDVTSLKVRTTLLPQLRQFVKKYSLAPTAFNTILTYWGKGDWTSIIETLPLDSDIYIPFSKLVGVNPLPKDGLDLQQILTNKGLLKRIKTWVYESHSQTGMHQIPIRHTALQSISPKIGIYSLIGGLFPTDVVLLGVYDFTASSVSQPNAHDQVEDIGTVAVFGNVGAGMIVGFNAVALSDVLLSVVPRKAHYQFPGSTYPTKLEQTLGTQPDHDITPNIVKPDLDGTPTKTTDQPDMGIKAVGGVGVEENLPNGIYTFKGQNGYLTTGGSIFHPFLAGVPVQQVTVGGDKPVPWQEPLVVLDGLSQEEAAIAILPAALDGYPDSRLLGDNPPSTPMLSMKSSIDGATPLFWFRTQESSPWQLVTIIFHGGILNYSYISALSVSNLYPAQSSYAPLPDPNKGAPKGWVQPLNNPSGITPNATTFNHDGVAHPTAGVYLDMNGDMFPVSNYVTMEKPSAELFVSDPVDEPVFPAVDKGITVSAGLALLISDGYYHSVVLVHPSNDFGYHIAFPKGRVDVGESVQLAAIRETYEETGFVGKPVAHLGDYKTTTGITRMYIGLIKGGSPQFAGWESDGVIFSNVQGDKPALDGWHKKAHIDVQKWLAGNVGDGGLLEQYYSKPSKTGAHGQVTQSHEAPLIDGEPCMIPAYGGVNDNVYTSVMLNSEIPLSLDSIEVVKKQVEKDFGKTTKVSIDALQSEGAGAKCWIKGKPTAEVKKNLVDNNHPTIVNGKPVQSPAMLYLGTVFVESLVDDSEWKEYTLTATNTPGQHTQIVDGKKLLFEPVTGVPLNEMLAGPYEAGGFGNELDDGSDALSLSEFKAHPFWVGFPELLKVVEPHLNEKNGILVSQFFSAEAGFGLEDLLNAHFTALTTEKQVKAHTPPPKPLNPATAKVKVEVDLINQVGILGLAANTSASDFTDTGKKLQGGSKPNKVLVDASGQEWFYKTGHKGDPNAPAIAKVENAVYQISNLVKSNNIPVGVVEFDGVVGSVQPILPNAESAPTNPNELGDANKAELLAQHALDMFVGDHDGHSGNILMVGGKLRAIDKGQAFRFLAENATESLAPSFHDPNRNLSGKAYAKLLLVAWGKDEAEIPQKAFAEMHTTVRKIQSLAKGSYLTDLLQPIFDGLNVSDSRKKSMLDAVIQRASSYAADWLKVLRKLRPEFTWSGSAVKPLQGVGEITSLGAKDLELLEGAKKSKFRGKALQLDSFFIEDQSVVAKEVTYRKKPATLLYWKLTGHGAEMMFTELSGKSKQKSGGTSDSVTSPTGYPASAGGVVNTYLLPIDVKHGYYRKIRTAIGNLNHHLKSGDKDSVKMEKVDPALALGVSLKTLEKDPSSSDDEKKMAELYLSHIAQIKLKFDSGSSEVLELQPFEVDSKDAEGLGLNEEFVSEYTTITEVVTPSLAGTRMKGYRKHPLGVYGNQFIITDSKRTKIGLCDASSVSVGLRGMSWAFCPLPLGEEAVNRITALLKKATNIDASSASKEDKEFLFWWKQAHLHQNSGVIQAQGELVDTTVDSVLKDLRAKYQQGDVAVAVDGLKKFVLAKMQVTKPLISLSDLEGEARIDGHFDLTGGRRQDTRLGTSRLNLTTRFGVNAVFAHHITNQPRMGDLFSDFKDSEPVLLSLEERVSNGVGAHGYGSASSPSMDFAGGGSSGVFVVLRDKVRKAQSNVLYFDIGLALLTDIYQVGNGDTYGNIKENKKVVDPMMWGVSSLDSNTIYTASPNQILVRYSIDLREYLVKAVVTTKEERQKCIQICKDMNWKFKHGKAEDIFVVR
jgi:hypothetical protein